MIGAAEGQQTDLPDLDVSIVTFNSARWLDAFFESLAAQAYPLRSIHVWVHDNGSGDDTVKRVRSWAQRWEGHCAQFEFDVGENIGFGRGHNANLQRAGAPFFLVSNVDLTFEPDALVRVVGAALTDSEDVASWEMRQKPYEHPKIYHPASLETLWSAHACVLFRRAPLVDVGGYEERLFLYGEDVELSYRLRDHGYKLRYVPSAVCWHNTYENPYQQKRAQFVGSKLANGLLRLRYGSLAEIFMVPWMYLALWLIRPRVPRYYRGLLEIGWGLTSKGPGFLLSRRRSRAPFPFRGWDYERCRPGAFHEMTKTPGEAPLVSVIIRTVMGRRELLTQALWSVANQTHPNVEVIVVEDGSSEARDLVEHFQGEGALTRVRHLALEKSGRCRAGNIGLDLAEGAFICFLDDDDLFYADHLEVLVAELRHNSAVAAAYGLAFEIRARTLSETNWGSQKLRYSVASRGRFSRPLLWDHNYLPIQSVVFRRELYAKYGGFDEELENLEDWNLWVRYSQVDDFQMVDRVTSLFTIAGEGQSAYKRLIALDSYRAKAVQKNALVRVSLSPADVLAYSREIARYNTVFAIRRSSLRSFALRLPFAPYLYHGLRRLGRAITRRPV